MHEDNTFLAKFLSKVDLQRAIAFGVLISKEPIYLQVRGLNLKSDMKRKLVFCYPKCGLGFSG